MIGLRSKDASTEAKSSNRFVDSTVKKSSAPRRSRFHIPTFTFKNRVAAIALLFATVPGLAIGAMSYQFVDRTTTETALRREQEITNTASQSISAYLEQRYTDIQALSNLPILNTPLSDTVPPPEKTAILERVTQAYGIYSNIAVFSPKGDLMLQAGEQKLPDQNANQANQAYFQATLDTDPSSRRAIASINPAANEIYISTPVREVATGKTTAIVRTTFSANRLGDQLRQFAGRDYRLIDASGRVVSENNLNLSKVTTDALNDKSQIWTDPQTNQRHLLTQTTIAKSDLLSDVDWRLVLSSPEQGFQSQSMLLALVSGVVISSALLAWFLSNRLTRSLSAMSKAVQAGSQPLPIMGQDEIAILGQTINRMSAQVETSQQEQQHSVQQLQQLNEAAFNIRKSADFDTIVQTGVQEVRQLLNVDRAIVYLFDSNWKGTVIAESVTSGFARALGAKIADPCFAEQYVEKYRAGRVHAIADLTTAEIDPCYRKQLEQFQVRANLVAPMLVEGQLIGLLVAHQCQAERQWQEAEMKLIVQIALHVGYAIEQVTLTSQVALSQAKHEQREVLSHELVQLLEQAEKAASGDLTVRAQVNGEEVGTVADFFNVIVEHLERVVCQVKQSALQVNSSLDDHELTVRSLSQDAVKQAQETALTLDHIQELIESIQTVASHAQQAAQVSQSAASTAEIGRLAVNDTVQDIDQLRQTMGDTAKKVKRLGESAQQISKAVSLINQIEMQTNVLAINAGIEAARSLENQGFTAIAEEVGMLAAKAAGATQEISHLVANIQQETIEVVDAIEQSTAQVVTGTQSAENAKQSLEKIMGVSSEIDQLVRSILEATASQVSTSTTMTELMQTIAKVAEQTSSSSLQVSSSLRETMSIAKSLQDSVQTFKVGV